ncbi:MAG: hypothetical protein WCS51_01275 [Bacilli bacterium]
MKHLRLIALPLLLGCLVLSSCDDSSKKVSSHILDNISGIMDEYKYTYKTISSTNNPYIILGYSEEQTYDFMNYLYYTETNLVLMVGSFYDWGKFSDGKHAVIIESGNYSCNVIVDQFVIKDHKMNQFHLLISQSGFASSEDDKIYDIAGQGFTKLSQTVEDYLEKNGLPELY